MKPGQFAYHAPKTPQEAAAILAAVAPQSGRVLAGGQSLIPMMALRLALPAHLVDINAVAGFDRLAVDAGELSIGACVRHAAFQRPVIDAPLGRILAKVVHHIAHYPIRTRGSRTIAAADFFEGMMATALAADELLAETRLPLLPADTRCGFYEFSRRAGDFAIAMSLAAYRVEGGVMVEPRVGVGGVEGHPRRIPEAEAALRGHAPGADVFQAAAEATALVVDPIDAKPEISAYKRDVVRAAVRRALEAAEQSA